MTSFTKVYTPFISLIDSDEWSTWMQWEREEDWKMLLLAAIPWFKFPRVPLDYDENGFLADIGNSEVQVLAQYMKYIWLGRVIDNTENLQAQYHERDFSPALTLKQLESRLTTQLKAARKLESIYYRSIDGKPYPFSRLSGGG